MKKNMGKTDSTIRLLVAIAIAILYFTHVISGTVAIILGIIAAVFILTSFTGVCPLYIPFGVSTRNKDEA